MPIKKRKVHVKANVTNVYNELKNPIADTEVVFSAAIFRMSSLKKKPLKQI